MKALYVFALLCLTVGTFAAAAATTTTTTTDVNYIDAADTTMGKKLRAEKQDPQTHQKALQYLNPNKKERDHAISRITDYGHKKMSNSTEKTLLDIDEVFLWLNVAELAASDIAYLPIVITGIILAASILVPEFSILLIPFDIVGGYLSDFWAFVTLPFEYIALLLWLLSWFTFPYEAVMLYFLITNYGPYSLVQKTSKTVCKNDIQKAKVEKLWAKNDYAGIGKQLCTIHKLPKEIAKKTKQDQPEKREKGKHSQTALHKMCGGVVKATHEATNDLVKGLDLHGFDSKSTYCENKLVSSYSF